MAAPGSWRISWWITAVSPTSASMEASFTKKRQDVLGLQDDFLKMNLTHFNHTLKVLLKYHVMDLECVFKIYAFADFCRRFFLSSWKWIQVSTKLVSSPDVASLASWRAWLICLLMKVYLHIHTFYIVCVYKYLPLEKNNVYVYIQYNHTTNYPCIYTYCSTTLVWHPMCAGYLDSTLAVTYMCIYIEVYVYMYIKLYIYIHLYNCFLYSYLQYNSLY
jgi:hypothetical protein